MPISTDSVAAYLAGLRPGATGVMAEMEALAARDGIPICEWETGRMLAALAGSLDGRVLEVGTAIGYSALHMAEAMRSGSIATLERDPVRIGQARDFLARAGVERRVEVVEGDALETIAGLSGPFDLLFLDATKGEYPDYLARAEELLSERCLLVVDNVLMAGKVADPSMESHWTDAQVEGARAFNEMLVGSAHGWHGAVLPVGDGVGLATRTDRGG